MTTGTTKPKAPAKKPAQAKKPATAQSEPAHLITAASTMTGDIMKCVLDLAKALPEPWAKIPEEKQDDWLKSVDRQVTRAVKEAVAIIASRDRTTIPAVVDQVVFKNGCKVVLNVVRVDHATLELAELTGEFVSIVIADSSELTSDDNKPAADPDQKGLDLAGGGKAGDPAAPKAKAKAKAGAKPAGEGKDKTPAGGAQGSTQGAQQGAKGGDGEQGQK